MERIVTSGQMKRLDQFTIQEMGVPSLVLMERAALAVTEELEKNFDTGRVLVVCGSGNNGGDGIAAVRLLYLAGVRTEIFLAGKMESFTEETRIQWKIAEKYGVPIVKNPDPAEYTTIVDAIFGVGLSRNVEGHYEALLKKLDASGVPVLAVDVPSGIDASRGRVMGTALHARQTVTFACAKAGLLLYPGASYAGQVTVRDVGICPEGRTMRGSNLFSEDSKGSMFRITDEDYRWLPPRNPRGNKGTFGKVLVVAGSRDMCGAAFFAAKASLLAGAGMVRIFTEEHNRMVLQQLLPEALLTTYREDEEEETLRRLLGQAVDWADVAAAGPGMGTGRAADRIVTALLADSGKPLVLDADGLNLLSRRKELLKQTSSPCILTPHMGEMCRLTGLSVSALAEDPAGCLEAFCGDYPVTCILKDARTVTKTAGGPVFLNTRGNSGMATAGSGDVLCGIAAGFLAAGIGESRAAPLAVDFHARAGDLAAKAKGEASLLASDILDAIPEVWKTLTKNYGNKGTA